jgi:hypothetical protein
MAGAIDISHADLEARFSALQVKRVFCDNGSNTVNGSRIASAISTARRIADAILLTAWNQQQIETIVAEDDAVRSAILDIALSEGMVGRLEWDSDNGPREKLKKQAVDTLKLLAQCQLRSIAETRGAGENPHGRMGAVRNDRSAARGKDFVFAPSKNNPSRGGF